MGRGDRWESGRSRIDYDSLVGVYVEEFIAEELADRGYLKIAKGEAEITEKGMRESQ